MRDRDSWAISPPDATPVHCALFLPPSPRGPYPHDGADHMETAGQDLLLGCGDGGVYRYRLTTGQRGANQALTAHYEAPHLEGVPVLALHYEACNDEEAGQSGGGGGWGQQQQQQQQPPHEHEPGLGRHRGGGHGRVFAGGRNGVIVVWDAATGDIKREFWHRRTEGARPVQVTALTGDGSRLLAGGSDGTVLEWFTGSGQLLRSYHHQQQEVGLLQPGGGLDTTGLCLHGGGLYSSTREGTVGRWRRLDGKLVARFNPQPKRERAAVSDICLPPDGGELYTASRDGCIRKFHLESEKMIYSVDVTPWRGGSAAPPPALLVECVGRCLFVGSGDGSLVMLDGESGDIEARLECWGSPLARSLRGNAVGGPLSIHGTSRSSYLPPIYS